MSRDPHSFGSNGRLRCLYCGITPEDFHTTKQHCKQRSFVDEDAVQTHAVAASELEAQEESSASPEWRVGLSATTTHFLYFRNRCVGVLENAEIARQVVEALEHKRRM